VGPPLQIKNCTAPPNHPTHPGPLLLTKRCPGGEPAQLPRGRLAETTGERFTKKPLFGTQPNPRGPDLPAKALFPAKIFPFRKRICAPRYEISWPPKKKNPLVERSDRGVPASEIMGHSGCGVAETRSRRRGCAQNGVRGGGDPSLFGGGRAARGVGPEGPRFSSAAWCKGFERPDFIRGGNPATRPTSFWKLGLVPWGPHPPRFYLSARARSLPPAVPRHKFNEEHQETVYGRSVQFTEKAQSTRMFPGGWWKRRTQCPSHRHVPDLRLFVGWPERPADLGFLKFAGGTIAEVISRPGLI